MAYSVGVRIRLGTLSSARCALMTKRAESRTQIAEMTKEGGRDLSQARIARAVRPERARWASHLTQELSTGARNGKQAGRDKPPSRAVNLMPRTQRKWSGRASCLIPCRIGAANLGNGW